MKGGYDGDAAINLGTGIDNSIAELAQEIAQVVRFAGNPIRSPAGRTARRSRDVDSSVLHGLGWRRVVDACPGLEETYRWCWRGFQDFGIWLGTRRSINHQIPILKSPNPQILKLHRM